MDPVVEIIRPTQPRPLGFTGVRIYTWFAIGGGLFALLTGVFHLAWLLLGTQFTALGVPFLNFLQGALYLASGIGVWKMRRFGFYCVILAQLSFLVETFYASPSFMDGLFGYLLPAIWIYYFVRRYRFFR